MSLIDPHIKALRALGHAMADVSEVRRPLKGAAPDPTEAAIRTVLGDMGAAFLEAAAKLEHTEQAMLDRLAGNSTV